MGGAKFLRGGDIPGRFSPLGGDFPRRFAPGGEYPRNIAPLLREGGGGGGRISCDNGMFGIIGSSTVNVKFVCISSIITMYFTIPREVIIKNSGKFWKYLIRYMNNFKNSLIIIHEEKTKKNHKRVVQIHVDLHKL
jgi:hypothetical protein